MKFLLAFIFLSSFSNCTRYYLVTTDQPTIVFTDHQLLHSDYIIESDKQFIAKDRLSSYYAITHGNKIGFVRKRKYKTIIRFKKSEIVNLQYQNAGYYAFVKPIKKRKIKGRSDDYSPYSSSGYRSSGSGPVQVRGYYRKNGTYVSPHTRSTPRRR